MALTISFCFDDHGQYGHEEQTAGDKNITEWIFSSWHLAFKNARLRSQPSPSSINHHAEKLDHLWVF